jgi:hypothetical protein
VWQTVQQLVAWLASWLPVGSLQGACLEMVPAWQSLADVICALTVCCNVLVSAHHILQQAACVYCPGFLQVDPLFSALHYSHPPLIERLRGIERAAAALAKKAT